MTLHIVYFLMLIALTNLGSSKKNDEIGKNNVNTSSSSSSSSSLKNQSIKITDQKRDYVAKFQKNYKKLFVQKRKEHLEAVRGIRNLDTYEQQYKMINKTFKLMVETVNSKRKIIEPIKDDRSLFIIDEIIKEGLSLILENTALFGDIVLQIPKISQRILKKEKSWDKIMKWALNFVDKYCKSFLDEPTIGMLSLVFQELNLTKRMANYSNPFWSLSPSNLSKNNNKKIIRKLKRKNKLGPQLIHFDL